jgi:hypothetical protein
VDRWLRSKQVGSFDCAETKCDVSFKRIGLVTYAARPLDSFMFAALIVMVDRVITPLPRTEDGGRRR